MSDEFLKPADVAAEDLVDEELDQDPIKDLPLEADPADVVDQRREVELDDEGEFLIDAGDDQ